MSSKTKIVVLRMKELIYTAIFVGLGILLVILLIYMFFPKDAAKETSSGILSFVPGVYSSSIVLGGQDINVEVGVDKDHINSIRLVNLSESVTTMYPLMEPALDELAQQICQTQSVENLTYSSESKYTSMALLSAIEAALHKAEK